MACFQLKMLFFWVVSKKHVSFAWARNILGYTSHPPVEFPRTFLTTRQIYVKRHDTIKGLPEKWLAIYLCFGLLLQGKGTYLKKSLTLKHCPLVLVKGRLSYYRKNQEADIA